MANDLHSRDRSPWAMDTAERVRSHDVGMALRAAMHLPPPDEADFDDLLRRLDGIVRQH